MTIRLVGAPSTASTRCVVDDARDFTIRKALEEDYLLTLAGTRLLKCLAVGLPPRDEPCSLVVSTVPLQPQQQGEGLPISAHVVHLMSNGPSDDFRWSLSEANKEFARVIHHRYPVTAYDFCRASPWENPVNQASGVVGGTAAVASMALEERRARAPRATEC